MLRVGASVMNGGISNVLGVFLLALAQYNLFRTYYFKMYMAIVLFGTIYGFLSLPVFLSIYGPSYAHIKSQQHLKESAQQVEMEESLSIM